MPSVLFDAVAIPDGSGAAETLSQVGHALEFLEDQYRHAKPILALGGGAALLDEAGIPASLPSRAPDPGMLRRTGSAAKALPDFVKAIARHRHHEREIDPPAV
jgi:catalase